jgi:hypothetical protein
MLRGVGDLGSRLYKTLRYTKRPIMHSKEKHNGPDGSPHPNAVSISIQRIVAVALAQVLPSSKGSRPPLGFLIQCIVLYIHEQNPDSFG